MPDSFATPWTVTHQPPLSMGISRQEYRSGWPFPPPSIFPTEGSNLCLLHLLHWQANSLPLSHLGNPFKKVSWSKICTKLNPLPLITTSHQLYGPCLGFPVETFFFGTLYWFTMDSSKSEVMSEVCKTSLPI